MNASSQNSHKSQEPELWSSILQSGRRLARESPSFGLSDLYEAFDGHPRMGANRNYREKLRQCVQDEDTFRRIARGRSALAEKAAS